MSKKCTPLWREARLEVKMHKAHHARRCSAKHISKSQCEKHYMLGPLLKVQMWFCESAPCQKWAKRDGFLACPKTMAGVGHLKRIWKDAFSMAGAVQGTCSSEKLGGQGADFLRRVHFGASDLQFWEDDFVWQVQHFVWPGITFPWQAQYFRDMGWKNRKTHWNEAVSSALNQLSIIEGSLAELLRFWCCQLHKFRKSLRIASFLIMSSSKIEEVLQDCFLFDVINYQIKKLRKSRRVASFSNLRIDRQLLQLQLQLHYTTLLHYYTTTLQHYNTTTLQQLPPLPPPPPPPPHHDHYYYCYCYCDCDCDCDCYCYCYCYSYSYSYCYCYCYCSCYCYCYYYYYYHHHYHHHYYYNYNYNYTCNYTRLPYTNFTTLH